MTIFFSDLPGRHERHLRRKLSNPLFDEAKRSPSAQDFAVAQRRDFEERERFLAEFRGLVEEAAALHPNEESEVLLSLKARLDQAYATSATLAGEQVAVRSALRRLIDLIMRAVREAAGDDAVAQGELADEAMARETNYRLLEFPLVGDLMVPGSPILDEELPATLLSETTEAVEAACWLFEAEHLQSLTMAARELLVACAENDNSEYLARLALLESRGRVSVN